MSTQQVEILFICGSPRSHSSEALLALLEQGAREVGARSRKFLLSKKRIAPCTGCGSCEKTGTCLLADESSAQKVADDYLELMGALSYADALAVVSPIYFAGPPAQLKALYDRLQPFWSRQYILKRKMLAKRPAQIFILGGGSDTHGYDPLITISKSALAVAGFSLEKVQNFIGFKRPKDIARLPDEEEARTMAYGDLVRLRREVALQREFEHRALAAGRAFARFAGKQQIRIDSEAHMEAQGNGEPHRFTAAEVAAPSTFLIDDEYDSSLKIVDWIDSDFEALKQAARASKSSESKRHELEAVVEEAVAALICCHEEDSESSDNKKTIVEETEREDPASEEPEPEDAPGGFPEEVESDDEGLCETEDNSLPDEEGLCKTEDNSLPDDNEQGNGETIEPSAVLRDDPCPDEINADVPA